VNKCKFEAALKKFSAKAAEEGDESAMMLNLSMGEPNLDALAALCAKPEEADKALAAVVNAGGKIEIPCGDEACALTIMNGQKKHEPSAVTFGRISLDSRAGECQMRISYSEKRTSEGGKFYLASVGQSLSFAVAPQQATIDEEIGRKDSKKKPAAASTTEV